MMRVLIGPSYVVAGGNCHRRWLRNRKGEVGKSVEPVVLSIVLSPSRINTTTTTTTTTNTTNTTAEELLMVSLLDGPELTRVLLSTLLGRELMTGGRKTGQTQHTNFALPSQPPPPTDCFQRVLAVYAEVHCELPAT
jgi:hypothetical protein